ncbi:MAG: methyltransferase domain-containing protein [Pseudomonadota bacterium]
MLIENSDRDLTGLYDRLAPDYDRLHRRWLKHAGGEAQVALEASVRALASPSTKLLDAGCGTGAFARGLLAEGIAPEGVTLLDPSDAMLTLCADMPVRRVKGRLEALPFDDATFDIVTCAWALETVPRPETALRELCRVVRPGGVLCLAFCATQPAGAPAAWLMRQAIIWRGTGQFLSRETVANDLMETGEFEVRAVPNNGPAAALIARRKSKQSDSDGNHPLTSSPGSTRGSSEPNA